ncbi:MAG: hypothetical protein ACK4UO_15055 [Pseudolabrys sp.]
MKALIILAAVADLAIAALLVAVSGFIFGSGPESMHAGALFAAGYIAAVIACLAAPFIGLVLARRGKMSAGVIIAWLPLAGALLALIIPAPY